MAVITPLNSTAETRLTFGVNGQSVSLVVSPAERLSRVRFAGDESRL